MLRRFFSAYTACSAALGTALVLASSIMLVQDGRRIRLGADALAASRGGNPALVLTTLNCNTNAGFASCATLGVFATCKNCGALGITQATAGANGGFNTTANGSCGNIFTGTCNTFGNCANQVGPGAPCPLPPQGPPTVQP